MENSKWPFAKWSWDSIHLGEEVHNERDSLEEFLQWLNQKSSGLSKRSSSNKNTLQELLLAIGLSFRDYELACLADHDDTPVPDYLASSCMAAADLHSINAIIQLISDFLNYDVGYVSICY